MTGVPIVTAMPSQLLPMLPLLPTATYRAQRHHERRMFASKRIVRVSHLGEAFVHRITLQRVGFTLVELVVVVMILGIVAAIAAPRVLSTSDTALENSARQTLNVVRDAIDKFAAENGVLPGADGSEGTLKADLSPYLRGDFPDCPVGDAANDVVRIQVGTGSIASGIGGTAATHGWAYKYETGDFHVNSTTLASDGVTTFDEF